MIRGLKNLCIFSNFHQASKQLYMLYYIDIIRFWKSNPFVFFFNLEMQTVALFLLAAYYKVLSGFPYVAVGALLLYVGCYQVGALLVYMGYL